MSRGVRGDLTPGAKAAGAAAARPRTRETGEVAAATQRMIRALGSRGAEGDLDALTELEHLRQALDWAQAVAVQGLRAAPNSYSWAQLGEALGITRQAAEERWRGTPGRKPGGQPGHLR